MTSAFENCEHTSSLEINHDLPCALNLDTNTMHRWVDALRHLPSDPTQMLKWIDGPLRQFFAFERVICVHGELIADQIVVTHMLTIGYTEEHKAYVSASFELGQRGALERWLSNRQPFCIDPETPPSYVTPFELEEIRRFSMGNIVAHGVLNAKNNAGTYFSFSGIPSPLSNWHLDAIRLISPVLNDLYLSDIANSSFREANLTALSPRQKVIVRLLIAGLDNKTIARKMETTEKTVRNQLSNIYSLLKIHKRSQLQAFLR